MYQAQEIVEKLRKSEEVEAITAYLYGKYQAFIKEQARKRGMSDEETKDLVQDVLIIFLRNVRTGKFEPKHEESIGSYVCEVARNLTYKAHRGKIRRMGREDTYAKQADTPFTPEELMIEHEQIKRSWHTFQRLCQVCRQIITAYYRDELSLAEIAKLYNLGTAEAVKVRKFRCMKELRKLLNL